MQRRQALSFLATAISGLPLCASAPKTGLQECSSKSHIDWAAKALERMLSVTPGMTRKELLRVLTTEGGISFRRQQTYVSRDCPVFKVRVEFEPVGPPDPALLSIDSENDVVRKVSEPFMQFPIMD